MGFSFVYVVAVFADVDMYVVFVCCRWFYGFVYSSLGSLSHFPVPSAPTGKGTILNIS